MSHRPNLPGRATHFGDFPAIRGISYTACGRPAWSGILATKHKPGVNCKACLRTFPRRLKAPPSDLVTDAIDTIEGLAGQQAMRDDSFQPTLTRLRAARLLDNWKLRELLSAMRQFETRKSLAGWRECTKWWRDAVERLLGKNA